MKKQKLTSVEQEKLKEFRVCSEKTKLDERAVPVIELLDTNILEPYLDKVQQELQATNKRITASLFSKRYAYLTIVPPLYFFSALNQVIDGSVKNLIINPSTSQKVWLPEIYYKDKQSILLESIGERQKYRKQLLETLFKNHLNPLWDHIANWGKVSKQLLWENTAIYLFWLYENRLQEEVDDQVKRRIKDDFHYILFAAEGLLFGNYNKNPLTKFYHQKTLKDGEEIRVRRTCCFYYEISDQGKMCSTCPKNC